MVWAGKVEVWKGVAEMVIPGRTIGVGVGLVKWGGLILTLTRGMSGGTG